jgi:hypothetical protein
MKQLRFYNNILNIDHISYLGIQQRPTGIFLVIILVGGNELCFPFQDLPSAISELGRLEIQIQNTRNHS